MKHLTVSVDEATYQRAQALAPQRGVSISQLVTELLSGGCSDPRAFERLKQQERELRSRISGSRAGDRISRDDAHGRNA